ncbi:MAG: pilus assembly protein PilM [Phycisphaerae bacterium]
MRFSVPALGSRRLISIDWDDRTVRLVAGAAQKGRLRRIKAVSAPLPEDLDRSDAAALGQFISQTLHRNRIDARSAVVDIPRDQAILNTLTLPATPQQELAAAVHFQIVKELPFSLGEAVVDFAVTSTDEQSGAIDVLVAAVRNDVVRRYSAVIEHAGLRLERVGLRPYANLVAVTQGRPEMQIGRVLLVDVGPSLTEIDILRDGRLVFSRAASVAVLPPGKDQAEGSSAVSQLMLEVTRSIEAHRVTEPGAKIERVVVTGATGIEPALARAAERRFGVEVELYDPARLLDAGAEQAEALRGFGAAIGLAVGHSQPGLLDFDFLHPKRPVDLAAARARRLRRIAVAVVVAVAAAAAGWHYHIAGKQRYLATLQAQCKQLQRELKQFGKFKRQVAAASEWARSEIIWLDHLKRISQLLPDNKQVYLTRLTMSQTGRITLVMKMANARLSSELAEKFEQSGYFASPGPATVREVRDRYAVTGDVRIRLAKGSTGRVAAAPKTASRARPERAEAGSGQATGQPPIAGGAAKPAARRSVRAAGRGVSRVAGSAGKVSAGPSKQD